MTMSDDLPHSHRANLSTHIAPVPRISLQAFCETPDLSATIGDAMADRRMDKAHVKVHMGGAPAAIEAFRSQPTPNVIVIEAGHDREHLHEQLTELSQYCDPGTKVVVVGRVNDIALYRDLMSRGISEYLVMPLTVLTFIEAVSALYGAETSETLGRIIAFTGAKGGVGSSCIAHNIAWSIARDLEIPTIIADLDLGFGTAGLDFNQDPPQGIADAVFAQDRLDSNVVDRLLSKCTDRLSILAAPATLDRLYDLQENAFDGIFDILRTTAPCIIVDVPHMWTAWSRRVLVGADDVIVVAAPDLANLRNTKSMIDLLRTARPNDQKPKLIMNGVGLLKRPEIETKDFAKAVDIDPCAVIPFDAKLFGTAANNGQMIGEVDPASKIAASLADVGRLVTGRSAARVQRKNPLDPFISRFTRRKAS